MTLEELLSHTKVAYLDQVSNQIAGAPDALWSDETITTHLNEAERLLCTRAWVLQSRFDAAKPHTFVTLQTSVKDYALHPKVLFIKSARPADSDIDLLRVGYEDTRPNVFANVEAEHFDVNTPYVDTPGRPQWFSTDIDVSTIRFRPAPTVVENGLVIQLRVVHLPINKLTVASLGASPETPEDYHEVLCAYAAGKCLLMPNIDGGNRSVLRGTARDFLAEFNGKISEAKRDVKRRQWSPPQFRFGGWVRGNY